MSGRSPIKPQPTLPRAQDPDVQRALEQAHRRLRELETRSNDPTLSGSIASSIDATDADIVELSGSVVSTIASSVAALSGTVDGERRRDGLDPLRGTRWFDEYVSDRTSNFVGNGGGASAVVAGLVGHPGLCRLTVSTSGTTNAYTYPSAVTAFMFGGGGRTYWEGLVRIPTLSNGTNNASFRSGFLEINASPIISDGVYFENDRSRHGGSNAWRFVTAATGSRAITNTNVTPTANVWTRLSIEVSEQADAITGSIDGTVVIRTRTYVPTPSPSAAYPPLHLLVKTLGAGALTYEVDYTDIRQAFTGTRA